MLIALGVPSEVQPVLPRLERTALSQGIEEDTLPV